MSRKRALDAVEAGREAAPPSPRKRFRRTVLVMMWLERRRARAAGVDQTEQMVRQEQLDIHKLLMFIMVLVARLVSVERVIRDIPATLERFLARQLSFQRSFMGSIEEKIRSVIQTEMQERQAASLPNYVYASPRQTSEGFPGTGSIARMIKLRFLNVERPNDPLYTGCPVQWKHGKNAKVAIFENERQITQGDLSKLQIEILSVHADFFTERGQVDFTKEEFDKQIYIYKGKDSVLTSVNLKNGEADLGPVFFPESSYRKRLRLTARVKRKDLAVRIQEAITDPFVVKDRRSEFNEKIYPPPKDEAIHRLEKISLNGKCWGDLVDKKITMVKHLLRHYYRDSSGLQKLTGMKKGSWSTMIKHATTSDPGAEIYSHRVEEENYELLFNDFYDLVGIMINEAYVPYSGLDQLLQVKVNNWKMSAHKKFEDLENSGKLSPDYFMINGCPVRAVPQNNDASTSIQTRTTWPCSNDMTAQHEFGERQQQENGFSPAQVFSNNGAGPSRQETLVFPQYTYKQATHQELCQQDPPMPLNEIPYLTHGNILDGQGSFSAQSIIPSHNSVPAEEDYLVTGVSLTTQHNQYSSSWTTHGPGTSFPVTGGVSQGTSSLNPQTDIFSGLPSIEELSELDSYVAGLEFVPANSAQLPNSGSQFHGSDF
ncbi:hypothetical protein BRADI_1g06900v3 [Brachypodium distachyon]|uniref:Uncharacterized protein n=1 Tax=Brachypodium distachyon TaxID=15368 RepID=I1GMQ1_BRADI|nr:hypothetical protein BRADI_1g06900v3 [Brachypodium distachyon]